MAEKAYHKVTSASYKTLTRYLQAGILENRYSGYPLQGISGFLRTGKVLGTAATLLRTKWARMPAARAVIMATGT